MVNLTTAGLILVCLLLGATIGFIVGAITIYRINTNFNAQHIPCGTATNQFLSSTLLNFKITLYGQPSDINYTKSFLSIGQFPNGTYWIQLKC